MFVPSLMSQDPKCFDTAPTFIHHSGVSAFSADVNDAKLATSRFLPPNRCQYITTTTTFVFVNYCTCLDDVLSLAVSRHPERVSFAVFVCERERGREQF